jgi:enamine deaminase RidA (YjgF/YER057c/UK114 family)
VERALSRHHLFNPDGMPPARGFTYGAVASGGRLLHIAGMTGHAGDGSIDEGLVEQFGHACASVARVVEEAGGEPSDVISMTIYTTDIDGYRSHLEQVGEVYRRVFGKHYPPMALIGVSELVDPAARVELVCVAMVPE